MTRICAVVGGSFDPPHIGHATAASWLRWTGAADFVMLVPTRQHAFGKESAPFERRLAACYALVDIVGSWMLVDGCESRLPTPSFTIRTLEHLRGKYPRFDFRLAVGDDVWAERRKWHAWGQIEREYAPVVVGRLDAARVRLSDISSTEIRRSVNNGEPMEGMIPNSVLRAWRGQDGS